MRTLILSSLLLCFLACGESGQQSETNAGQEVTDPAPADHTQVGGEVQSQPNTVQSQQQTTSGKTYPSIPIDRLEYLWNNSNYMDVVFYQLPVSLNQSTMEQIRSTIMGIGEEVPAIDPACQSIGRIFFQVDGDNVETAEIFFQQGCTFYLWLEDEQPAYANQMTEAGVNFYNNIMQQVQAAAQSTGQ
ncbi:MAG: hypothetical protein AAGF87_00575 [Bacteroidota bacterium]